MRKGKRRCWGIGGIGLSVAGAKEDVRNAQALVFVYLYLCICICASEKVLESGLIHVCGGQRRPRRENLALVGDHRALLIAIIGR